MPFDGHEDHRITLQEAAEMTKRYRDQMTATEIKGGYFGRDAIEEILEQPDCVGIRYYYGLDTNGSQVLVLTGVLANENDMQNGALMERSRPCPPACGSPNQLNSN